MGKIAKYARSKAVSVGKGRMAAPPVELQPPASEGEMPDAAPPAPPLQTSSTPKMVTASTKTMRKPFKA